MGEDTSRGTFWEVKWHAVVPKTEELISKKLTAAMKFCL